MAIPATHTVCLLTAFINISPASFSLPRETLLPSQPPTSWICQLSDTNHFHTRVFAYSLPPTRAPLPFLIHIPTTLVGKIYVTFSLRCCLQAVQESFPKLPLHFLSDHLCSTCILGIYLLWPSFSSKNINFVINNLRIFIKPGRVYYT